MPHAFIHREEVMQRAGEYRVGRRKLPGSARAVYACLVLSIDTDRQEQEKAAKEKRPTRPPCERVVESARSWLAAKTGYSERSVTRALKLLPQTPLVEVIREADESDVFRRRVQQYVLPLAPRGHWRQVAPRKEQKRARQDERSRQKRDEALRNLPPGAQHIAVTVPPVGTEIRRETKRLPLLQPRQEGLASPAPQEERGGDPPRIPPAERAGRGAGAIPRESPPTPAAANRSLRLGRRCLALRDGKPPDPDSNRT